MIKKILNFRNMVMIACLAVASVMFLSCSQSAKETEADASASTVAEQVVTPAAEQPVTPVAYSYYGYEGLRNGRTFSIILELTTKGEEKTITKFVVSEGIIERGTRDGYSYVSKRDYSTTIQRRQTIEILADSTFSSKEGSIPISGKWETDIIRGVAEYGGKKYQFEAKTSNVERCTTCFGRGFKTGTNIYGSPDMGDCGPCEGFGFKISR